MSDLSKCRSCGAPVVWLRHAVTDKRAPIDAEPSAKGNLLIDHALGIYLVLASAERALHAGQLHTNHFMTCPSADRWGKPRGKAGA